MHIVWAYFHPLRYICHLCTKFYGLNQRAEGAFLPYSNWVVFFYTKMWGYHVDIYCAPVMRVAYTSTLVERYMVYEEVLYRFIQTRCML